MVVHLLGKQNIGFHKHHYSGLLSLLLDSTSKQNEGNLKAILNPLITGDSKIATAQ